MNSPESDTHAKKNLRQRGRERKRLLPRPLFSLTKVVKCVRHWIDIIKMKKKIVILFSLSILTEVL